jgi:hypothetical protein
MWERFRRFRQLPAPARGLFLRAALLLPWVKMRLRIQGFQATKNSLHNSAKPSVEMERSQASATAALTARAVRAAARHGIGSPSCLEESLVLIHLLRWQGVASQLRIGVKKDGGKFEAHAWVEQDGVALNESEALHDHYAPFDAEFSSHPPAET